MHSPEDSAVAVGQDSAPAWFSSSVATPAHTWKVTASDGAEISCRQWGNDRESAIVLVHGVAANSHWWDHVAPHLASDKRSVVAVDLAGHGDSGRRATYTLASWSADVLSAAGVINAASSIVVGHSMGGRVAWHAATQGRDRIDGLVTIDSPIWRSTRPLAEQKSNVVPRTTLHTYSSRAEIMARFRTLPPQPEVLPYVRDHIAGHSIIEGLEGWTWKHDPRVFHRTEPREILTESLQCPVAFLSAEHGIAAARIGPDLKRQLADRVSFIEIPHAGHHIMLDQPLALITALRSVLSLWRN